MAIGKISVVIPCYRSEKTIGKVVRLTREEITKLGYTTEFVLVNDCSPDDTVGAITQLARTSNDVIAIDLAKNFGQHGAIMSGLHHVTGDFVLLMDDDMQTHPSQIKKLLGAMDENTDVVFGKYPARKEALWRRLGSKFSHWTMQVMSNIPANIEMSNYVLMREYVAREMCRYEGPFPTAQGLIFQITTHISNADVEHFDRESGVSGYTLRGLVKLWLTFLNSSMLPLRIASFLGAFMGAFGIVLALILVLRRIFDPNVALGWSSTIVAILTCSGIIVMALGIVGEYVGRLFLTVNKMPQFIERRQVVGDPTDETPKEPSSQTDRSKS